MGIPDRSLIDLIEKVKSWLSVGASNQNSREFNMTYNTAFEFCYDCELDLAESSLSYRCQTCGKVICENCIQSCDIDSCKFCSVSSKKFDDRIQSIESASLSYSGVPSPLYARRSPSRSDEEEGEDSENHFFSSYSHYTSDVDSSSEFYSFKSVDQETTTILKKIGTDSKNTSDFEDNSHIWSPPPPEFEEENNFFTYDDEDDEFGESSSVFSSSNSLIDPLHIHKNEGHAEPLVSVVQGHFRALVSQLLHDEGIKGTHAENWLDIVTSIAWQAANFVKPDTEKGGSMDPGDYVKIKCISSGHPSQSKLVRGVVCTKNIKHKRMISQYKNPRLLVLGGALEYQRVPNQLASFDTLLQQEIDYIKTIVSKIEAHRPNVLLVEKSVSSYAQEYLLAKEISLVLNVKRSLLERISSCTGATLTPSVDKISTTNVGHCELFRLEKVSEEHEPADQFNKKPSKTLMFFEGCPRRLGCTVVLKGSCVEELKKIKHVVQYAIFAAYHLSLETSFLADEGASLPDLKVNPENTTLDVDAGSPVLTTHPRPQELSVEQHSLPPCLDRATTIFSNALDDDLLNLVSLEDSPDILGKSRATSSEYYSSTDNKQSILVSFSSRSILTGTVCERSRLLRIKFYGCFDKPLGKYLRDDLFDTTSCCGSCKEPADAHVICYTHGQGNLTINVRRVEPVKLGGEEEGKIWMWHRCLRCTQVAGVPPATKRVVMSDAAWGLSFGKFLELSFSNHATANRVATCGHSLQKDCVRYYGFGSMVAFFRYSPVNILSVCLPPSVLDFDGQFQQVWLLKEAAELSRKIEALYNEISSVLVSIEQKITLSDTSELRSHITELKELLLEERRDYSDCLQPCGGTDILELNHTTHSLLISSHIWDRRLYSLDSLCSSDGSLTLNNVPKRSTYDTESTSCNTNNELDIAVAASLSEKIDSAWTGIDCNLSKNYKSPLRKLMLPTRVYSFDSALRNQKRSYLFMSKSFHAFGDYRNVLKDPVPSLQKKNSLISPVEGQNLNLSQKNPPSFVSAASLLPKGSRFFLQSNNVVIAVYDNEPTSIISYALTSKEYENYNFHKAGGSVKISFEDEMKVKFSVTCYFAKEFDRFRKKCGLGNIDFVRSLSRCCKWNAQGGKSNVYFAKSFDERFIIKQVTKTELVSFEEFGLEYFNYLTDSLDSGSPTCLAKVLGIYQVSVKGGGKETKMELMIMENLFFGRNISRVYDLKGSARSRYNPDTSGRNKVLLDMNLVESLRTNPIFLGSKAKRSLERAVWNDTSFLTSVDVMDYSLLVGVDEGKKELVIGIIDYMRQYTWDKHLETWVKASGILGGPKNAPPTIISPKQYKTRFRKALTAYFLTVPVPHQWNS
jgi:1-phosphatidylinositol-3-phosphate 5-kinase